jgi:hypothetical protein
MLESIHQRLGIPESDPTVKVLEESTLPEALVEPIETTIEKRKHG